MLEKFFYFQRLYHTFSPDFRFHRSHYEIIISDDFRVGLGKGFGHVMLEIVLVSNYELTFWAVAACFTQSEQAESVYMDE